MSLRFNNEILVLLQLMRHLLGTHLGHNGVLTMCCILEDSNNWYKFSLLRGAIFFVGMCLWGSKRVTSLLHKPIAVLPSFYKVLSCDNESVICEVTLSMQRLVKKYGMKQHDTAWESILDIASALQEYVERHPSCTSVSENFHVLLSYIEELHEKHEFYGSADKLFAIVAKCTKKRPESSVILLVSHRAQSLHPYCDNWFENIKDLVDRYFKCEERTAIRIKVLDVLCNILGTFSPLYEEEILENSVLPYLDHIAKDRDIAVRIRAVQLLVDVIEGSDSQKVCDVLNIIEKIARCPVDPLKRYVRPSQHGSSKEQPQDEKVLRDIKEAVLGLVRLFKVKLLRKPQEHAERIFGILVSHIKAHYDNGYRTYIASQIRLAILKCFLSLRADSGQRLGMVQENNGEVKFSSYFACSDRKSSSEDKTSGLVSLPYSEAMNVILMCLQQELEWEVLDVVLTIIPETLEDKNLILSGKQYLNSICTVLSKMVSNYDFLPGLFRVPHDMRRPHLYARIFPVLTELCTYHPFIGQDEQVRILHHLFSQ
ncbi:partial [Paramuricea clavata]|uniref:Partial n=1 Tax=Paramuricea clavata TaxID=317549 RepID=A0A6S7IB90_PARCT|nr:partial [Paramuricea clavata]